MKAIIVGRDAELIGPLTALLTEAGFAVILAEGASAVLALMRKHSVAFVLLDPALLSEQNLSRELFKRFPMVRLIGLAARPTIQGLIEAVAEGAFDYFPRSPDYFDAVLELLEQERRRLARWQRALLTDCLDFEE